MSKPKGVQELPRVIQGGLLRYFKHQHERGRPMSDIWAELFEEDKFRAMDLAMKCIPKELLIQADINHAAKIDLQQLTPEQVQEAIRVKRQLALVDATPGRVSSAD